MKLTAELKIYNDQERFGENFIITGSSENGKGSNWVEIIVNDAVYQIDGGEIIEAVRRVSGELLKGQP